MIGWSLVRFSWLSPSRCLQVRDFHLEGLNLNFYLGYLVSYLDLCCVRWNVGEWKEEWRTTAKGKVPEDVWRAVGPSFPDAPIRYALSTGSGASSPKPPPERIVITEP